MMTILIPVYNSSATIRRTLDSLCILKGREKLEVIISDDASTDETIDIVQDWLVLHSSEFKRVLLVKNMVNLGISANHQAAFDAVKTTWAMYIGGDDLLVNPDFLTYFESYITVKQFAIAKVRVETLTLPENVIADLYGQILSFFRLDAQRQFSALAAFGNFLYAGPGTVVNMDTFRVVGGLDTRFRSFEDIPLFFRFLTHGYKIELIDIPGVQWVRSVHSLSAGGFATMKPQFIKDLKMLDHDYIRQNLTMFRFPFGLAYRCKNHIFLSRVCAKICRTFTGYPR